MNQYKVKVCGNEIEINKTPKTAIKAMCTDCSNGQREEVKLCPCEQCPLYPFRGYINWSGVKREMTDEQKEANKERLSEMRAKNPLFQKYTKENIEK